MGGLKIINNPAVLNFLLTEDLYAVNDTTAVRPQPSPGKIATAAKADREKKVGKDVAGAPHAAGTDVFHYLGENRRFILALVSFPDEKHLPLQEKEFLEKVLSSVDVTLEDIALLNYAHYPAANYSTLKDFFAFDHLLLFGVSPNLLQLPGPVLPYHLGLVEGVKILAADSPEILRPDNTKKRALWEELKRTFSK